MNKLTILAVALVASSANVSHVSALELTTKTDGGMQERAHAYFGCGKQDKANCSVIGVTLKGSLVQHGIDLELATGEGSTTSMQYLCDGTIQTAIVQADVWNQFDAASCPGMTQKLAVDPAYEYSGYLVLRADAKADSLHELLERTDGVVTISGGGAGSGGQTTLGAIQKYYRERDPKNQFTVEDEGWSNAKRRIATGDLTGFFFMGAQGGTSRVAEVRDTVDEEGNRVYKVVAIDMESITMWNSFFGSHQDAQGNKLYKECKITFPGLFNDVTTLCTGAIGVANSSWLRQNNAVAEKIEAEWTNRIPVFRERTSFKD